MAVRALHYSIASILVCVLANSHADARGGGGGGGGVHGGFAGGHASFSGGLIAPFATGSLIAPFGFVHNPNVARATARVVRTSAPFRRTARFDRFDRPTGFQNGSTWDGGWGWPVGDWTGGCDWTGGYYGYANPPVQQAPSPPQVIVINTDGQSRMQTAEAPADYSYVKGCHVIPNGYHCDALAGSP